MVKYVINLSSDKFLPHLSKLEGSFLLLNETCHLPDGHSYSFYSFSNELHSESLWEDLKKGNFFFRTSSELEKGVIISKIIIGFPNARLITHNHEVYNNLNRKLKTSPITVQEPGIPVKDEMEMERVSLNLEVQRERPAEQKLTIPPRLYSSNIPQENPIKEVPQASPPKEFGPNIGNPRFLIQKSSNLKDLHDNLDPIIRSNSLKDSKNFHPRVFENEPVLKSIFNKVLESEKINQVKKFFQLFEIVSQIYLTNERRNNKEGDDLSDMKKVLSALFDTKIVNIKNNPGLAIESLFTKNCWNIELELKLV